MQKPKRWGPEISSFFVHVSKLVSQD